MKRFRTWLRNEFPQLLLLIVGILAMRSSLADHYYVPSGSMEHTLIAGDRVAVNKAAYGLRIPFTKFELREGSPVRRGDVVIFDSPRDGVRLIKRIVAVGGDRVTLNAGRLSINGTAMATGLGTSERFDSRIVALNLASGGGPDIRDAIVPSGFLLAIGDHRGNSVDGRYFGYVNEADVYGKAIAVYRRRSEGFTWRPL